VFFLLWSLKYCVLWKWQGKQIFPGRRTGTSSSISPVEVPLFPFLFPKGGSNTSSLHVYCVIPLNYNFLQVRFEVLTVNINITVFCAVTSKEHIAPFFTAEESDDLYLDQKWNRCLWCVGTHRSDYTVSNPGRPRRLFFFRLLSIYLPYLNGVRVLRNVMHCLLNL
jgi:hypothetical protein